MQFFILSGSTRQNSASTKVADFISTTINKIFSDADCHLVDLAKNALPLWDESEWTLGKEWNNEWTNVAAQLQISDALIIVVPEWHGMCPPQIKNFFQLATDGEIAHKPCLLIGISSGLGGTYPIAELRMSAYKNTHVCFLPDHVIVRNVTDVLNLKEANSDADEKIRERLVHGVKLLENYAQALRVVRKNLEGQKQYPYGM